MALRADRHRFGAGAVGNRDPGRAVLVPGFRERMAATAMKTLTAAEADFRANDRDRNHVNDFWTGDVSGLYYVKSADGGAEVRLIDVDVANADSKPIHPLPSGSGPRKEYRYQALDRIIPSRESMGFIVSIPTGAVARSTTLRCLDL